MDISLGEVSRGISDLKESNEKLHEKVDSIVIQTTRTNGRVGVLEEKEKENKKMRDRFTWVSGGTAVFMAISAVMISLILFSARAFVKDVVSEVLKEKNIVVSNLTQK